MKRELLALLSRSWCFRGCWAARRSRGLHTGKRKCQVAGAGKRKSSPCARRANWKKSANLAVKTGNEILQCVSAGHHVSGKCGQNRVRHGIFGPSVLGQALHIRNESVNPEESQKYTKLSDELYAMVDENSPQNAWHAFQQAGAGKESHAGYRRGC